MRSETCQFDQDTRRDLDKVIKKLKEMKKIKKDQYLDQEDDNNPLFLELYEEIVPTTLRIPKEKYDGTSDPTNHISCFQTTLDPYDASDVANY